MSENKNIWIINQYTSTPKLGGGGNRSYYIAKELVGKGYNVSLITASYSHVPKRNFKIDYQYYFAEEDGINLVVVKNIVYESGRSIFRILSMLIFWIKLYFLSLKKMIPPDIIIVSSISLLPILNAFYFKKKFKNKLKIILEVRDIWPLSLIELGGFSKYNPFVLLLSWIEKNAYMNCDYVTSVLPLAYKHFDTIAGKKVPFKHISNGIHLGEIQHEEPLNMSLYDLLPRNKFLIGYTGALGIANSMIKFIDLAIFNKNNPNLYFVIVGDGYLRNDLIKKAEGLNNILFLDRIPKSQVQSILKTFDLLYIAWHDRNIYNYGISANKIFDYMYSEKPILMSGNIRNSEVDLANCGKVVYTSNIKDVNNALSEFCVMSPSERLQYGKRAKEFILKFRTYEYLSQLYIDIFQELKKD